SLTLCASAGTEPGGKVRRWSVGHDLPPRGSWQAPARRLTHGPSPLKALARPGLSFIPKLECWRKAALTATSLVKVLTCYASSLLSSSPTKDSSRASNIQCSATFSYALFMKGSVACAPLSAGKRPAVTTFAALPQMHRTKRQAAALVPVVMTDRRAGRRQVPARS